MRRRLFFEEYPKKNGLFDVIHGKVGMVFAKDLMSFGRKMIYRTQNVIHPPVF